MKIPKRIQKNLRKFLIKFSKVIISLGIDVNQFILNVKKSLYRNISRLLKCRCTIRIKYFRDDRCIRYRTFRYVGRDRTSKYPKRKLTVKLYLKYKRQMEWAKRRESKSKRTKKPKQPDESSTQTEDDSRFSSALGSQKSNGVPEETVISADPPLQNGDTLSKTTEETVNSDESSGKRQVEGEKGEDSQKRGTDPIAVSSIEEESGSECDSDDMQSQNKEVDINTRIREQLNRLKSGKRDVSILDSPVSRRGSRESIKEQKDRSDLEDVPVPVPNRSLLKEVALPEENGSVPKEVPSTPKENSISEITIRPRIPELAKTPSPISLRLKNVKDLIDPNNLTKPVDSVDRMKFFNRLINKLKSNEQMTTVTSTTSDLVSPRNDRVEDGNESDVSGGSGGEFLGFTECELVQSNIPGSLPTPVVKNSSNERSAFVSERLDAFMRLNSLENVSNVQLPPPKEIPDRAMVLPDANPPPLPYPEVHQNKPRTVAEKRQLIENDKNVIYSFIDNESTVYRNVLKRSRTGRVDRELMRCIQQRDIPFRRDTWRTTSFLNTEDGKFYYQYLKADGREISLYGSCGNASEKFLFDLKQFDFKQNLKYVCTGRCKRFQHLKIYHLKKIIPKSHRIRPVIEERKVDPDIVKPDVSQEVAVPSPVPIPPPPPPPVSMPPPVSNQLIKSLKHQRPRAGPLCSKQRRYRSSIDCELGPKEIYQLPIVKLTVYPQHNRPLAEAVKPYLKDVALDGEITKEWAEFACSAVKEIVRRGRRRKSRCKPAAVPGDQSFTFELPYRNNETSVLVRRRRFITDPIDTTFDDNYECKFRSAINEKSTKSDRRVADCLEAMFNAVAINLNERLFESDDLEASEPNLVDATKETSRTDLSDDEVLSPIKCRLARDEDDVWKPVNSKKYKKSKSGPPLTINRRMENELRKLNATIIKTTTSRNKGPSNVCGDYCKMGCICSSLQTKIPIPHCRLVDCQFECTCPITKDGLETGIQVMHERAKANLAKVEASFTSTLVVQDDKTIYIPSISSAGKRLKKAPSRYGYVSDDDEATNVVQRPIQPPIAIEQLPGRNQLSPETNRLRKRLCNDVRNLSRLYNSQNADAIVPYLNELERLRHVNVVLHPLRKLESIEPWCMVHCVYRCFCKLKSVHGKPFSVQENQIPEPTVPVEKVAVAVEPNEVKPLPVSVPPADNLHFRLHRKRKSLLTEEGLRRKHAIRENVNRLQEILEDRTNQINVNGSIRINYRVPDSFRIRNAMKAGDVNATIRLREEQNPLFMERLRAIHDVPVEPKATVRKESDVAVHSSERNTFVRPTSEPISVRKRKHTFAAPPPFVKRKIPETVTSETVKAIDTPIKAPPLVPIPSSQQTSQPLPATLNIQPKVVPHSPSVSSFNHLVTWAMVNVVKLQKKTLTALPTSTSDILPIRWSNLIDLYQSDSIFIWNVNSPRQNRTMLLVTSANIVPTIPPDSSMLNISVMSSMGQPLLAKLIKTGVRNERTEQFCVLMQSKLNYWKILGCMYCEKPYLTEGFNVRPTPETHPKLSSKIQKLFGFMEQRRTAKQTLINGLMESLNILMARELYYPQTNILIKSYTASELSTIPYPIEHIKPGQRYFMMSLGTDFSHICLPSLHFFLAAKKIRQDVQRAIDSNSDEFETITVPNINENGLPQIYFHRRDPKKLFFGPYGSDDPANLILCYEATKGHIVPSHTVRFNRDINTYFAVTTGTWIDYMDRLPVRSANQSTSASQSVPINLSKGDRQKKKSRNDVADSDDDCLYIFEEIDDQQDAESSQGLNIQLPTCSLTTSESSNPVVVQPKPSNFYIVVEDVQKMAQSSGDTSKLATQFIKLPHEKSDSTSTTRLSTLPTIGSIINLPITNSVCPTVTAKMVPTTSESQSQVQPLKISYVTGGIDINAVPTGVPPVPIVNRKSTPITQPIQRSLLKKPETSVVVTGQTNYGATKTTTSNTEPTENIDKTVPKVSMVYPTTIISSNALNPLNTTVVRPLQQSFQPIVVSAQNRLPTVSNQSNTVRPLQQSQQPIVVSAHNKLPIVSSQSNTIRPLHQSLQPIVVSAQKHLPIVSSQLNTVRPLHQSVRPNVSNLPTKQSPVIVNKEKMFSNQKVVVTNQVRKVSSISKQIVSNQKQIVSNPKPASSINELVKGRVPDQIRSVPSKVVTSTTPSHLAHSRLNTQPSAQPVRPPAFFKEKQKSEIRKRPTTPPQLMPSKPTPNRSISLITSRRHSVCMDRQEVVPVQLTTVKNSPVKQLTPVVPADTIDLTDDVLDKEQLNKQKSQPTKQQQMEALRKRRQSVCVVRESEPSNELIITNVTSVNRDLKRKIISVKASSAESADKYRILNFGSKRAAEIPRKLVPFTPTERPKSSPKQPQQRRPATDKFGQWSSSNTKSQIGGTGSTKYVRLRPEQVDKSSILPIAITNQSEPSQKQKFFDRLLSNRNIVVRSEPPPTKPTESIVNQIRIANVSVGTKNTDEPTPGPSIATNKVGTISNAKRRTPIPPSHSDGDIIILDDEDAPNGIDAYNEFKRILKINEKIDQQDTGGGATITTGELGYLISKFVSVGKFWAKRKGNYIYFRTSVTRRRYRSLSIDRINLYLNKFLRERFYAYVPDSYNIEFRFVLVSSTEHLNYPIYKGVKPNLIVTEEAIIDLDSHFELNFQKGPYLDGLLALKLATLVMNKNDVQVSSVQNICRKALICIKYQEKLCNERSLELEWLQSKLWDNRWRVERLRVNEQK